MSDSPTERGFDPASLEGLLRTALYDTGGETVEGAFVDHSVSYASEACSALQDVFRRDGFPARAADIIRGAARAPDAPEEALISLLCSLRDWTPPLIRELRTDSTPGAQVIAVRAGGALFGPVFVLDAVADPAPAVRAAAIRTVASLRLIGRRLYQEKAEDAEAAIRAEELLRRALDDEDNDVRIAAAQSVKFYREPAGGTALVERLDREPLSEVRAAILIALAQETRREGLHAYGQTLADNVGAPVKAALLRELNNADAEVRRHVAAALARLSGPDIASALLARLLIEQDHGVRLELVRFSGYWEIADRALPILAWVLACDSASAVRAAAGFAMKSFRHRDLLWHDALSALIAALDDPAEGVRRAAVMTLAGEGGARALPLLARELARPDSKSFRAETQNVLRLSGAARVTRAALVDAVKTAAEAVEQVRQTAQEVEEWHASSADSEAAAIPHRVREALQTAVQNCASASQALAE